jgi:hypothetical protein
MLLSHVVAGRIRLDIGKDDRNGFDHTSRWYVAVANMVERRSMRKKSANDG